MNTLTGEVFLSRSALAQPRESYNNPVRSLKNSGVNISAGKIFNLSDLERINIDKTITGTLQGNSLGGQFCWFGLCAGGAKTISNDSSKYMGEIGIGTPGLSAGAENTQKIGRVKYQNGVWVWKWED